MSNNFQIDKETLNKLLTLSDSEFKRKISQAAENAGVKNDKLDKMLGDIKSVKKTLGNMSEEDLKRAAKTLSSEKVEELLESLKKNNT